MHTLHLGIVNAESPEEACNAVESYIEDYGNENNWRSICGCVSEDDEVFINDADGRFSPDNNEWNTIKKINKMASKWADATSTGQNYNAEAPELMKNHYEGVKLNGGEWWQIEQYAKHMRNAVTSPKKFDVFKHEYMEYEYDTEGVTHLHYDKEEGYKTYVVFIDMHS